MEKYDITDYLKDDKELQKAVIEEFLKEIEELKAKNFELKESLKCFQTPEAIKALTFYKTGEFELQEKKCIGLEQENDKLKEEIETRDNLVEHFRKESINWAEISNDCIKDIENYKQTLQEIKAITTECTTCGDCCECKYCEDCDTDIEEQALGVCKMILDLITKAEEE